MEKYRSAVSRWMKIYNAIARFEAAYVSYGKYSVGKAPSDIVLNLAEEAERVLDLYRQEGSKSHDANHVILSELEKPAEKAKNFFDLQVNVLSVGGPKWKRSEPSTKRVPSRCPSNVSSSKATGADAIIDIPNEVHNEGDALPMPNVQSKASNSAPASSFGHSVFAQDGSSPSSIMPQDCVHFHGNVIGMPNDWSRASNSSSASSSSHSVFAQDGSSPSSTMPQDMPSGPHFDQPETSNARATTSHILDDVSASEASNESNTGSEILNDSDSEASNSQANTGSEIHNRDIDNDHSARIERLDIRAREKFQIELNAVIAAITGQAVFNLTTSTATDSPFLRCCAATAGIGFFGSLFAICFTRNEKAAKYLSKIGAIGAVSAVSFGLGITVLKDTEWYLNLVATGIACLVSTGVIAMADM